MGTLLLHLRNKMACVRRIILKSGEFRWRVIFTCSKWGKKGYIFYSKKRAEEFAKNWEKEFVLFGPSSVKYDRLKEKWNAT